MTTGYVTRTEIEAERLNALLRDDDPTHCFSRGGSRGEAFSVGENVVRGVCYDTIMLTFDPRDGGIDLSMEEYEARRAFELSQIEMLQILLKDPKSMGLQRQSFADVYAELKITHAGMTMPRTTAYSSFNAVC